MEKEKDSVEEFRLMNSLDDLESLDENENEKTSKGNKKAYMYNRIEQSLDEYLLQIWHLDN